jgi:DNA repair exonuclease SbcCD ATPase subunit
MQELINSQLGMDETSYMKSIWFGQRMKSLVESDNKDKRELFEAMFNIDFEPEKAKASERVAAAQIKIKELENSLKFLSSRIDDKKVDLLEKKETLRTFEETKKSELDELEYKLKNSKEALSKMKATLKSLVEQIDSYDATKEDSLNMAIGKMTDKLRLLKSKIKDFEAGCRDYDSSITRAERKVSKLEEDLANVKTECPSCKGPLKPEDIQGVKSSIKEEIKNEVEGVKSLKLQKIKIEGSIEVEQASCKELDVELAALDKELSELKASSIDINSLKMIKSKQEGDIKSEERMIDSYLEQIEKVKSRKLDFDLDAIEVSIKEDEDKIGNFERDLVSHREIERVYSWWASKGFSASGIKSFVFNSMLTALNAAIRNYAYKLGVRVEFSVDLTKASKPFKTLIYKGDHVRDYADLSGGQKQRIDVCVAFAMYDIICENSNVNIMLMDEIFEGLDNAGVDVAFDLIRAKSEKGKSVFVITHSDVVDSMNCKSVLIEADVNGNTIIN